MGEGKAQETEGLIKIAAKEKPYLVPGIKTRFIDSGVVLIPLRHFDFGKLTGLNTFKILSKKEVA